MDNTLAEAAQHGVPRKRGKLTLVDISGARPDEYRMEGNRVIVPISKEHGGVEGQESPFGPVVFRKLDADFRPVEVNKEFRLDARGNPVPEQSMPESAKAPAQAENVPSEEQAAASEMLKSLPPQTPLLAGSESQNMALMMQMTRENMELRQRLEQLLVSRAAPAKESPPPPTEPAVFVGPWGRIAFKYKDIIQAPGCIILVGSSAEAQDYEPPVEVERPFEVHVRGVVHRVVNPGLSFVHAGDKLSVLVVCQESQS